MQINNFVKRIKDNLLWLIFTNHCKYCNTIVEKGENMCAECRNNLPEIKGERCKFCGAGKERCGCKKHRMAYDGITSPFYYEGGIKSGIQRLKFNGKEHIARTLAVDMANCVKSDFSQVIFDFICFVPFTTAQKIRRNYNQSELLANHLSKMLEIPLKNVLIKLFETESQHTKNIRNRSGNVFGVYDIKANADVKGKTILLVDDIKTTGSTLNECAWILKIRGAKEVYCVTASMTGKEKKNNQ